MSAAGDGDVPVAKGAFLPVYATVPVIDLTLPEPFRKDCLREGALARAKTVNRLSRRCRTAGHLRARAGRRPRPQTGWRVRDVAAHVALAPQPPTPTAMLVEVVRARGSFHRLNHDIAVRHADSRTGVALVAELRDHTASRRLPPVTNYRNILFDTLVHAQDIAIPLRRRHPMPPVPAPFGSGRRAGRSGRGDGWPVSV